MQFESGTRIGPYEILTPIGKGGMGEVFRARDERIGREVAIKFLPVSFAEDQERLSRFEQEARSAGALNHPNLVTIHELGRHEGAPYIVMELLEGLSLRDRLTADEGRGEGSPITPRKAVEYAVQIAEGLAAAHERGVVHRDLKPENLFVTDDGRVKILDFGLAKQTEVLHAEPEAATAKRETAPGTVMGTAGYMSPEQVRGQHVDHRTDVFSFGAVLYEMLSGKRAFSGESSVETMNAILKEDPLDLGVSRATSSSVISPALDQIVRHCLEKNRNERFQSMRDVAFALGHLSSASGQALAIDVPGRAAGGISRALIGAIAILAVLLGVTIGWLVRGGSSPSPAVSGLAPIPPQVLYPVTYSGHDSSPSVSPDGRMIAFVSTRDQRSRIWLRQLDGGGELALTEGLDSTPIWSPDGSTVLFVRQNDAGNFSIYRVPALGGAPRKVTDDGYAATWSPDGLQIAFLRTAVRADEGYDTAVMIIGSDGSGLKEIARLDNLSALVPSWSPDGTRIAVGDASPGYRNRRPSIIKMDGTVEVLDVLENQGLHSNVVWLDNDRILMAELISTTFAPSGTGSRLFVRNLVTGVSQVLLYTQDPAFAIDVGSDGRVVAGLVAQRQNLRELSAPGVSPKRDRWLTRGASHDRQPAYSRDGKHIIFSSTMSGNLDLWSVATGDGALRRLTEDASDDFDPAFGSDGRSIIWSSRRSGNYEIWIADADGTNARQLTKDGVDAENPTMTADGSWVVYNSYDPDKAGIWKIRTDGTDATQIIAAGASQLPEVSPDGKWVAYSTSSVGNRFLYVVSIDGGEAFPFTDLTFGGGNVRAGNFSPGRTRWSGDGKALVYLTCDEDGTCGLRQQDFVFGVDTTSTQRRVTEFELYAPPESFSMAPDGRHFTVSASEETSRIVITKPIAMLAR